MAKVCEYMRMFCCAVQLKNTSPAQKYQEQKTLQYDMYNTLPPCKCCFGISASFFSGEITRVLWHKIIECIAQFHDE
jgi:tRNA(Arg) A34 adenosine deaminase TadA